MHATTAFNAPHGKKVTTGIDSGLGFLDRSDLPARQGSGVVDDGDQRRIRCAVVEVEDPHPRGRGLDDGFVGERHEHVGADGALGHLQHRIEHR